MGEAPFRKSVFIVDRQRPELLEHLRAHFDADPDVEVVWDRRTGERRRRPTRGPAERRWFQRRGAPPESWASMGFIFLPGDREVEGMPPRQ